MKRKGKLERVLLPLSAVSITISVAVVVGIGWIIYELGRE
jgi:hypothetical protein